MPVSEAGGLPSDVSTFDNGQHEERRADLVRSVFSVISPDDLGGLTIDELVGLAAQMHRTLEHLEPWQQREPDVFASIDAELREKLGGKMVKLETPLKVLGYAPPIAVLSRIARDELNLPLSAEPAGEDDED